MARVAVAAGVAVPEARPAAVQAAAPARVADVVRVVVAVAVVAVAECRSVPAAERKLFQAEQRAVGGPPAPMGSQTNELLTLMITPVEAQPRLISSMAMA